MIYTILTSMARPGLQFRPDPLLGFSLPTDLSRQGLGTDLAAQTKKNSVQAWPGIFILAALQYIICMGSPHWPQPEPNPKSQWTPSMFLDERNETSIDAIRFQILGVHTNVT